jgi:hypothetical protein
MMKKVIAVLVIFVCVGTALSAQINIDMSAGAGALFGGQFTSYSLGDDGKKMDQYKDMNLRYINFGGFAFFDAIFNELIGVEADVGLRFGTQKLSTYPNGTPDNMKKGTSLTYLTFGLFGRYPITLGGFTVFPLLGIQYDFLLAANDKDEGGGKITVTDKIGKYTYRDNLNRFWIKLGAGADIDITSQIYVRPSFLYGFAFKNKGEKETIDTIDNGKANDKILKSIFTHGFDIRVAAGYRF